MASVEWALKRGKDAEQEVQRELIRLAPRFGFHHLTRLLIAFPWGTSQLDHVLVDRYGVLVLETKLRRNAVVLGRDVENRWTAHYPATKKNYSLENPLRQNAEHENALRQALRDKGLRLKPDFVNSAVVFVGAKSLKLEMHEINAMKVVRLEQLEKLLARRNDFVINKGDLSRSDVSRLLVALCELDCSGRPQVARRHEQYLRERFQEVS
ncbi:MAG TPA: nuclease-related domain-containing protein [Coriobacteriia bacterium]|jgi:hypothetical protein